MNRLERIREKMLDWEIDQVNRYLKGEHVHYKRGRYERWHVAACLVCAIERECGIHAKGIQVGSIHLSRYKKEVKRIKKYWDRVVAGKSTNSQRGFDKERKEAQRRRKQKMTKHMDSKRFDELGLQGRAITCRFCGKHFALMIVDTIGGGYGVVGIKCPHCDGVFAIEAGA